MRCIYFRGDPNQGLEAPYEMLRPLYNASYVVLHP